MTHDTTQLICEGGCNPQIGALDEQVRMHRKDCEEPVGEALAAELRTLKHTPHKFVVSNSRQEMLPSGRTRLVFEETWACEACGRTRIWG